MRSFHPARFSVIAIVLLALALSGWAGVWYLWSAIGDAATTHAATQDSADSTSAKSAANARVRALALDTATARQALMRSAHADIVSSAKVIESVGAAAHVSLKVSGAFAEQASPPPSAAAYPLHAIGFSVEATGSFAAVMKAAELLDTLPLSTTVEQFDIAQIPQDPSAKGGTQWRLTERIRLLTDSDLSS